MIELVGSLLWNFNGRKNFCGEGTKE